MVTPHRDADSEYNYTIIVIDGKETKHIKNKWMWKPRELSIGHSVVNIGLGRHYMPTPSLIST